MAYYRSAQKSNMGLYLRWAHVISVRRQKKQKFCDRYAVVIYDK